MFQSSQPRDSYIPLSVRQIDADNEFDEPSPKDSDYLPTDKKVSFRGEAIGELLLRYLRTVVTICAAILLLAACAKFFRYQADALASREICQTEICRRASEDLKQAIGSSSSDINPCVDFAQHTCGGWNTLHDLREDQGNMFTGTLIQDQSDELMRQILEDYQLSFNLSSQEDSDKENLRKVQQSYAACMNEEAIKDEGIEPLAHLVKQLGAFFPPLKDDSILFGHHNMTAAERVSPAHLTKALSFLNKLEVNALFSMDVVAEPKNPHLIGPLFSTALQKEWPSMSHYEDENFVKDYASVVAAVLNRLPFQLAVYGPESSSSVANVGLAESIIGFERDIAKAIMEIKNSANYSRIPLNEAQDILPIIDIRDFISSMGLSNTSDAVMVTSKAYLLYITELVSKNGPWVVQGYLSWKLIQRYYTFIQSDFVKPLHDFSRQLAGQNSDYVPERWRTCVHHVIDSLDGILSRFYIERAFPESKKKHAEQIVATIKNAFKDTIRNTKWMSERTQVRSIEKLDLMVSKIGYSSHNPDLRSPSSVSRFKTRQNWQQVGARPGPHSRWDRTATSFNAYYNREHNEIVIPAGFMQEPAFYGPEVPSYLTYGAFGAIVGHEISHAFDSTGRYYDSSGARTDWWDTGSAAEFDNRTQCFIEQYDQFTILGDKVDPSTSFSVDGHLTLDENLADYSGLHAAFAAYQAHELLYPSKLLPGLAAYSREQLFFLAYGRYWCEKNRKQILLWRLKNDPHAPNFARVQGAVANELGFGAAWKCAGKSQFENKWVPRCVLW